MVTGFLLSIFIIPNPEFNCRYEVRTLETNDGSQAIELSIQRASAADSGIYVCEATNPHGSSATDFSLLVEGLLPKMVLLDIMVFNVIALVVPN